MKRLTLLSLLITGLLSLITLANALAQTIRIANNNPGATSGTNVYTGTTALQDAIDAAVTGDIIHVIPSSVNYGSVIIEEKTLTVFGIGLNPQKNIGQRSLAQDISLNGVGSSGSRISGMHFERLLLANSNATVHTVSNILCENSQLEVVIGPGYLSNAIANIVVRNCVLNGGNNTSEAQVFELYTSSGVIITNNIIKATWNSAIQGDGLTIQNNLFISNGTRGAFYNIDNCLVQNNIFYGMISTVSSGQSGNSFINNISFGSNNNTFTSGVDGNTASGNLENTDPMLTNVPIDYNPWVYSYDMTLITGSPAINAGQDGTDMGPSGGANPFDTEGTLLPLIEAINLPAVVTKGTDLQVNIKAKGN